jgi:hypothetical protein
MEPRGRWLEKVWEPLFYMLILLLISVINNTLHNCDAFLHTVLKFQLKRSRNGDLLH